MTDDNLLATHTNRDDDGRYWFGSPTHTHTRDSALAVPACGSPRSRLTRPGPAAATRSGPPPLPDQHRGAPWT